MAVEKHPRGRAAHRAAEPLAWWVVLLALYLAMASALTLTEIAVGAAAAAAGAAAATAANRALFSSEEFGSEGPAAGRAPRRRPDAPARLLPALARLPGQVAADTARIIVRGASGGDWAPLAVAPGRADRGAAVLLLSAAPAGYVGGVDPDRDLVRMHRLVPSLSPYERSLRRAGLISEPGDPAGETTAGRGTS